MTAEAEVHKRALPKLPLAVYQYRLLGSQGSWLGDFILRSDGFFAAVTGYGSYAYRWPAAEGDFRAFVADLEDQVGYVASKLSKHDWFDGVKTLESIKRAICEGRREGHLTKKRAKEEWDILCNALRIDSEDLRGHGSMDYEELLLWHAETKMDDAGEMSVYDYPPDVRAFGEKLLPRLAVLIRAELAAEQQPPAQVAAL